VETIAQSLSGTDRLWVAAFGTLAMKPGRLATEDEAYDAACPSYTATDLNNFQGTRTVQEAAREPVRLALPDANGPTGTFSNEDGPLPW
jgi:hypothetical protein